MGRILTIQLRTLDDISPDYDCLKYQLLEKRGVLRGRPAGKLTITTSLGFSTKFCWEYQHVHKNYLVASEGPCKMVNNQLQLFNPRRGVVGQFPQGKASFGEGIDGLNPVFLDGLQLNKWKDGFRAVAFNPTIFMEWKIVNIQRI